MTDKRREAITVYISAKLLELRKSAGWSQSTLAKRVGITSAAISQLEKGDRLPSLIVSYKLAEALHISVAELVGDDVLSSSSLDTDTQLFFRRFGELEKLSITDQTLIVALVKRLKEKTK